MKKKYLLIALLLISGFSFGQYFPNHGLKNSHNNRPPMQQSISGNSSKSQNLSNKKQLDSLYMVIYNGGTITPYAKQDFTYNSAGLLATNIIFENINQVMVQNNKENYIYDANNRLIERYSFKWQSSTNQWGKEIKAMISYSTSSYVSVFYSWNSSTNQWVKGSKKESYQNQSSLDTLTLSYTWNNQWNLDSRTHYSYNLNNDMTLSKKEVKTGNNWVNNNKTEWVYDVNFNLLKTSDYFWDLQTNAYINSFIYKNGYDSQNKKVYDVAASYNSSNSSWNYYDSTIYTYSANSNFDSIYDYGWNTSTNMWELSSKNKLTYDNNYALSELILPIALFDDDDMLYFNHMLTQMKGYDYDNGQWELSFIYDLYYSDFVPTSIDQAERNTLSVVPNPAQDYFLVNMDGKQLIDITIYDATGRLMKTQKTNSNSKINIRDLKSGIYFLQITDANKRVYSSKLIKR